MRTTLTLDDDVAALLKRALARRKDGRYGLRRMSGPPERRATYRTLAVADGDFARFPGLRWENPLA